MSWIIKAAFVIAFGMGATWTAPPATSDSSPREPRPAPAKEFACGDAAKPCPLQGWMRTKLALASTRGDAEGLAKGFDFLAANPPPGYSDWAPIARQGAGLARKKDIEGSKAACQSCHSKYKSKYKEELRDRAL